MHWIPRQRFIFLFGLFYTAAAVGWAAPGPNAAQLQRLPPAVRQAVREYLDPGTIEDLGQSIDDDGLTVYDVTINKDGKSRDFTFAADGSVQDMQVFLEETPGEVQKTILAEAHGAPLGDITKTIEDGKLVFDVEMVQGGKTLDFTVAPDGRLLDEEVFLEATPLPVQKTIEAQKNGGQMGDITRVFDESGVTYQVDITNASHVRTLTMNPGGVVSLTQETMAQAEAPEPVQKAIYFRSGRLVKLTKSTEDGEVTYDVAIVREGKSVKYSLLPDGHLAPAEP